MKNGKLIAAGFAAGAVIALFLIPKTRHIITDAVSSLAGSLKNMASNAEELTDEARRLAV